jgi:hypothetical protein
LADKFKLIMTSLIAVAAAISSDPWSSIPFHDISRAFRHVFSYLKTENWLKIMTKTDIR